MAAPKEVWICAHDFSEYGKKALTKASEWSSAIGAKLILVHSHPLAKLQHEHETGEATFNENKRVEAELEDQLAPLRDRFQDLDVEIRALVGDNPSKVLVEEAHREGATCIVVGSHGRTGLAHLVMGSVAEDVVKRARVPVLVVKGE
jgi:nucleotide-binding universal stress UspA family protein